MVNMSNRSFAIAIAVVVLLMAVAFRFLQLLPYPKGDYNFVTSPNDRHKAYVYELIDQKFFSREFGIYTLKVEYGATDGRTLVVYEREIPRHMIQGKVNMRDKRSLAEWTPDSHTVTFLPDQLGIEATVPF